MHPALTQHVLVHADADGRHRASAGAAAHALSSAAHLPAEVAMAAGRFIVGDAGRHSEAGANEPRALYHEDSAQMRAADHREESCSGNGKAPPAGAAAGSAHAESQMGTTRGQARPGATSRDSAGQQEEQVQEEETEHEVGGGGGTTAEQQPDASTIADSAAPSVSAEVQTLRGPLLLLLVVL